MLRFKNLGSGSTGNCTLVEATGSPAVRVLIDCGLGLKNLLCRLAQAGVQPEEISALFITHEHADHIGCARTLALRYKIPVQIKKPPWGGFFNSLKNYFFGAAAAAAASAAFLAASAAAPAAAPAASLDASAADDACMAEPAAAAAEEAAPAAASAAGAGAAGAGAGAATGAGAGAGASSFLPQAVNATAATMAANTSDLFIFTVLG